MPMVPSRQLKVTAGWKYQLAEDFTFKLINTFTVHHSFQNEYYCIAQYRGEWWITAKKGCCYDGPTGYPDFNWTMIPSLKHDILHWLIAKGVIPEEENWLIDKELADSILAEREPIPLWQGGEHTRPFRAWTFRIATGLVYQKVGEEKEIFTYNAF